MNKFVKIAACGAALVLLATPASAVPIYGGSDLLGAADASQLEQWLGQGSIALTNIFDKEDGDQSGDFHAAVDGQGATFTLIEVTGNSYGAFEESIIIGGYNPFSWGGSGYHYTTYGMRDAFIFNLTSGAMAGQLQSSHRGQYQTYSHAYYGPTFGGGHDIHVGTNLDRGYTYSWSYATYNGAYYTNGWYTSILGTYSNGLYFGGIEVFTIDTPTVAEPNTILLLTLGLLGLGLTRRQKTAPSPCMA